MPTDDTSDVMVKLDIVEKVGLVPYGISNTTPNHSDFNLVYFELIISRIEFRSE